MKCDTCKYFYYESASNNPDNARLYPEIHCVKGHWNSECPEGLDEDEFITHDPWKNCIDYKEKQFYNERI